MEGECCWLQKGMLARVLVSEELTLLSAVSLCKSLGYAQAEGQFPVLTAESNQERGRQRRQGKGTWDRQS